MQRDISNTDSTKKDPLLPRDPTRFLYKSTAAWLGRISSLRRKARRERKLFPKEKLRRLLGLLACPLVPDLLLRPFYPSVSILVSKPTASPRSKGAKVDYFNSFYATVRQAGNTLLELALKRDLHRLLLFFSAPSLVTHKFLHTIGSLPLLRPSPFIPRSAVWFEIILPTATGSTPTFFFRLDIKIVRSP